MTVVSAPLESRSRRPWLAALLSIIVPGLGQVYVGRTRRGMAWYVAWWSVVFLSIVLAVKLSDLAPLVPLLPLVVMRGLLVPGDALVLAMSRRDTTGVRGRWYVYAGALAIDVLLTLFMLPPRPLLYVTGFRTYHNPAASMEPTLLSGDYILVDQTAYHFADPILQRIWLRFREPRRGEVVAFRYPLDPSNTYLKRVIALPGETVEVRDGRALINESPLTEDYLPPPPPRGSEDAEFRPEVGDWGPDVVPAGHVFVLGDSRDNSRDSRSFGCVPMDDVLGRAVWVYWSRELSRSGWSDRLEGAIRWHRLGHRIR